jgi:hypothetical protein
LLISLCEPGTVLLKIGVNGPRRIANYLKNFGTFEHLLMTRGIHCAINKDQFALQTFAYRGPTHESFREIFFVTKYFRTKNSTFHLHAPRVVPQVKSSFLRDSDVPTPVYLA